MPVEIAYYKRDPKICKVRDCPLLIARERYNPNSDVAAVQRVFGESGLPNSKRGDIIVGICRSGNLTRRDQAPCGQFWVTTKKK